MEKKFNQFYFHSVRNDLKILEFILMSNAVLSREKSCKYKKTNMGFNGNKWISVCKYNNGFYEDSNLYDNYVRYAFPVLVRNKISIVLDDKIDACKTSYMSYDEFYCEKIDDDSNIRFSDCLDEYQVKDSIPIEHFVAITFPFEYDLKYNSEMVMSNKLRLQLLLSRYNLNVPIIDSSDDVFESDLVELEKRLVKRI